MTLFELLFLLLCVGFGVGGALLGGGRFGAPGYFGGFVLGALFLPVFVVVFVRIEQRLFVGPPRYPPCRCGKGSDELQLVQEDGDRFVMHCTCGARYWRRGGRIFRVEPGRELRPYMRWHPIRRWIPDRGAGAAHDDGPYR
jgi:hypothetical protein